MTFISYAQNFEDVLLWRALKDVATGFYIDVGAWHPDTDSVTRAFYDRGWHGINIEPVEDSHRRLLAARPRDLSLAVALGAAPGEAVLHVAAGSGLSTLYPEHAARAAAAGFAVHTVTVPQRTLAEICAAHAPGRDIHFLKIDAEGAEQAVLEGADFSATRPWIVLLEAVTPMGGPPTFAGWEPILLRAGYRFVWFDGLNRFYVADEHHARLAPHFAAPPNVFDGFIRAGDSDLARLLGIAQQRALSAEARAHAAEQRLSDSTQRRIEAAAERLREHAARLEAEQRAARAEAWVEAVRTSTSWRLLGPLRRTLRRLGRDRAAAAVQSGPAALPIASPTATPPPPRPAGPPLRAPLRSVHQFHSGSARHDAITNALFLIRDLLRGLGYASEIYVEHRDPALAADIRMVDELPTHADYVLLAHHSLGFDAFAQIAALPAPKVLVYHNITPPEWLGAHPKVQANAVVGRTQLAAWRGHAIAALAASDYNALELRALGFDPVRTCTLLFDLQRLQDRAAEATPSRGGATFTVLFVGRIAQSKGQDLLVQAFAAFRRRHPGPSRLVLVGGQGGDGDPFLQHLVATIQAAGLAEHVLLTGLVSDDERDACYAQADLYVSLSHHEGFGVPLVEAMAHGVPVLAWPAGAVPYTLGGGGALLDSQEPEAVGARIAELAANPARRAAIAAAQSRELPRFALDAQLAVLRETLLLAGAAPPAPPAGLAALRHQLRFCLTGHLDGSYSLAAINRRLAGVLEAAAPGSVRLVQIEAGQPVADLSHVPPARRDAIAALAARPPWATGPEIVISQHYPVHVPAHPGDALLAYVFWEESAIPRETVATLDQTFRGVLAPSAYVARTLVDNGVSVPVRLVGFAPEFLPPEAAPAGGARPFTFLHVSSCFPRKGVDVLLRAWAAAFGRDDDVRLIIKGFANPHNDAAAQAAGLRAAQPGIAPIEVIDADLDEAALAALYAAADAMVLPSRGEGFCLPAAEALAAGLPLIITGHGGQLDFCTPATARLVDFSYARSASHLAEGISVWAEPDQADLARALRDIRDDPAAAARRAQAGAAAIRSASQPAAFARRVREAALDLLLRPPDGPLRLAIVSSFGVRCGIAEYTGHLIDALPDDPRLGALTVLADDRRPPDAPPHPRARVQVAWRLQENRGFAALLTALAAADPHAVMIQHQPGLFDWPALAALLAAPKLSGRVVTVTLHNTRHLGTIDPAARAAVLAAFAGISRVIVHTIADLNTLKSLGAADNIVLIPQGVVPPAAARPPRALPETAAPVIGCTGFFLPGKGIPELIEAAGSLRATWPGLRLRLVNAAYGHPDSAAEIARARAAAARTGMAAAIDWHTDFLPAAQSRALLEDCDLVALPYQASLEASSAALRSALGAGVPVLTTPLPLFDEAGPAVLRASGTDPAALAAGLAAALSDQPARARAQAAAQAWTETLAWPRIADRVLGMLCGLRASDADLRAWRTTAGPRACGGTLPDP